MHSDEFLNGRTSTFGGVILVYDPEKYFICLDYGRDNPMVYVFFYGKISFHSKEEKTFLKMFLSQQKRKQK